MAKATFTCSKCGTSHGKWVGQCDSCMEWNTLVDQGPLSAGPGKTLGGKRGRTITLTDLTTVEEPPVRTMAGRPFWRFSKNPIWDRTPPFE